MDYFLGILNYKPSFYTTYDELLAEQQRKLQHLINKRISEMWVVWDTKRNKFFAECPVILRIENFQLELCAYKLDEFSVTWNSIDIKQEINWYGMGNEFNLEWRKNPIPDLDKILNKPIDKIYILEYIHHTTVVDDKTNPELVGKRFYSGWLINGIEFHLETSTSNQTNLTISNGLDENEISFNLWRGPDFKATDIS